MKKNVILIVDTGIDDATAIVCACFCKQFSVKAIITTGGNIGVSRVTKNTLGILEYIKKDIPVFVGDNKILSDTTFSCPSVHGENGVGGFNFPPLKSSPKPWSEFLPFFMSLKRKVSFVVTSPLTNMAVFLQNTNVLKKIDKIVVQTGLIVDPNYVSFNVAVDPKSAEMVLASGAEILVCPSDMGHLAFLNKEDVKKIQSFGKTGQMLEFMFRSYHDRAVFNDVATHDPCAVAYLENENMFETKDAFLCVVYDKNGVGRMCFDFSKTPNAKVCTNIDIKSFKEFLFDCIKQAK